MPKKDQGWITFQSSEEERQLLEQYCQQTQRSKTEILRELVRSLPPYPASPPAMPEANDRGSNEAEVREHPVPLQAVKISARNILKATVKRLVLGGVNAEATLELAPDVNLISVITRSSAEQLNLAEGKEVYAVIKSSSVMIAEKG